MERETLGFRPEEEDTSRRWVVVLLYNLFVALWLLAVCTGYGAWRILEASDALQEPESQDAIRLFGGFFALLMAGILLVVWRRIPGWFRWTLLAGLLAYVAMFAILVHRLELRFGGA